MVTRRFRSLCLALCPLVVLLLPAGESPAGAANAPKKESKKDSKKKSKEESKQESEEQSKEDSKLKSKSERAQLGENEVRRILKQSGRSATAKEAFEMLDTLIKSGKLAEDYLEELRAESKRWEERVAQGLVRNGDDWISKAENESRIKQADERIQTAINLINVKEYKGAKDALVKASNVDKGGILPDFLLGLLNGPFVADHADSAKKYFERVLRRVPGHAASLNNLALAEIRDREFTQALKHWKEAAQYAPLSPELTHNLAKLLTEAKGGLLKLTDKEKSDCSKLYASLAGGGAKKPNEGKLGGWRYMGADLPRAEESRGRFDKGGVIVQLATGTGFVVHDRHILTSRHVVEDADLLTLEIATTTGRRQFSAEVVAISNTLDLALIKADDCDLVPLDVSLEPLRGGTEIMLLGYPVSEGLGKTIKTARGTVSGNSGQEQLTFDAAPNPGNSGGPVCERQGNVIAVLTSRYEQPGQLTYFAMKNAGPFLKEKLPGFRENTVTRELDWPEVDKRVSQATLHISVLKKVHTFGIARDGKRDASSYLEDNSCSACNGKGQVKCSVKECRKGQVAVERPVLIERNPSGDIWGTHMVPERCLTCNGKGTIKCRFCSGTRNMKSQR